MKKLALVSGLLFVVVYLVVNTTTSNDNSFDVFYPPLPGTSLRESGESDNPVKNISSPEAAGKYSDSYLIIASFIDLDQARNAADDFSARFDADFIVLPPTSTGYYRVSYGRYSSAEEARNALEYVKQNGFPDVWILPPD